MVRGPQMFGHIGQWQIFYCGNDEKPNMLQVNLALGVSEENYETWEWNVHSE